MSFHSWLQNLRSALAPSRGKRDLRRRGARRAPTHRLSLEFLENRLTPSFTWIGSFPAGPTPPYAVATGDFTNDGNLDVATAADTVNILAGNGDGTLQPPVQIADLPTTPPLPGADFTSDGIPGRIYRDVEYNLVVRPGRGDGTFGDPIYSQTTSGDVVALATADLNGDGRLDLVLGYSTMDMGGVGSSLLGCGDGTFGGQETFGLGLNLTVEDSRALVIGDFNNDGRPDIAAAGADPTLGEGAVAVLLNDGNWTAPPPSLRIGDVTVKEGNTGKVAATFSVSLSSASSQTVTAAYASGNGTATVGSDYQAASGTLTFAPGETSKTVTVPVISDRLAEANETFAVNLSSPTNATIADGQGLGTIVDDEPRISISDVTKSEGKKNQTTLFTFTVTLSAAYDQPVTMSFKTTDGTAKTSDGDYTAKTGTLTFAPGETTKTITITVKGDNKQEDDETFSLELSAASANSVFAKSFGMGTIINDDSSSVTNTADSGAGSLRQAISAADNPSGTPDTIEFQLPAGPQTISPASPLPDATDPLTLSVDATQNPRIVLPLVSPWQNHSSLRLSGAGSLTIVGGLEGTGSLTIDAGSSLTSGHIVQDSLVIGGSASDFGVVTIGPSDDSGNPFDVEQTATESTIATASALSLVEQSIQVAQGLAPVKGQQLHRAADGQVISITVDALFEERGIVGAPSPEHLEPLAAALPQTSPGGLTAIWPRMQSPRIVERVSSPALDRIGLVGEVVDDNWISAIDEPLIQLLADGLHRPLVGTY